MKLKDLKEWLSSLPHEFDEYEVVNGEVGELDEQYTYRIDKPVMAATVDEETKEVVFFHDKETKNKENK